MKPLTCSLVLALGLLAGCATSSSHANLAANTGSAIHTTSETQGSTASRAFSAREMPERETVTPTSRGEFGIPTPQPARDPGFATPTPQPPIPSPNMAYPVVRNARY